MHTQCTETKKELTMKNKEFVKKEVETGKESHTVPAPASTSKSPTPESKMGPSKEVNPTEKKED